MSVSTLHAEAMHMNASHVVDGEHPQRPSPGRASAPAKHQPSATSKIIMMLKPAANIRVPILECCPADISGIVSESVADDLFIKIPVYVTVERRAFMAYFQK